MSFRELPKSNRVSAGAGPALGTVNAAVTATGVVRFAVAEDVLAVLGNPSALKAMLGDGEHQGHIALLPAEAPKTGAFRVRKQKAGRQGMVFITASRIGVPRLKRGVMSLPTSVSATGVIVDLRPLRAPSLAVAA